MTEPANESRFDLTAAIDAVMAASPIVWRWEGGALVPYRHSEAREVAEAQVRTALPHILDALAAEADREWGEIAMFGGNVAIDRSCRDATKWLRRKAVEALP